MDPKTEKELRQRAILLAGVVRQYGDQLALEAKFRRTLEAADWIVGADLDLIVPHLVNFYRQRTPGRKTRCLTIGYHSESDELEALIFIVNEVKGRCDYKADRNCLDKVFDELFFPGGQHRTKHK